MIYDTIVSFDGRYCSHVDCEFEMKTKSIDFLDQVELELRHYFRLSLESEMNLGHA